MVFVEGGGEEKMRKSGRVGISAGEAARLVESSRAWSPLLLSSSLPLSSHMVVQTLLLIHSPLKALSFFNWAKNTAGFTHTRHSYSLMLQKLCDARLLDTARDLLLSIPRSNNGPFSAISDRFFNLIIRSYGSAGLLRHSLAVFSSMNRAGVSPSVITFNSLLHLLLRRGRTSMAKSLFSRMLSTYGVHPDTYTFNILIRGLSLHSMLHEALHFFHKMPLFRCPPDIVTYNTLIDAICRSGNPHRAHRLLETMWKDPPASANIRPDTATYTALIRGYCRKKYTVEALSLYRQMLDRGIKPNNITMNTLLQGLSESRQLHRMKEVSQGFSPDTCTFNTLIKAHCQEGRIDKAMALFSKMSSLNVAADSATYSTLVRGLYEGGEEEKGEEMVEDMMNKKILLHNSGCMPIPQAFSPVLRRLCSSGRTQRAERVLTAMMKRGVPDPTSFQILIMGHCREGRPESGYRLLLLMLHHGCAPSMGVYECLLEALLVWDGGALMAYKALMKMPKRGWGGGVKIIHAVLSGLVRGGHGKESGEVVRAMVERGVRQNIGLSTEAVKLIIGEGMCAEGLRTVRVLYEGGFRVRVEEVVRVLLDKGEAKVAWDMVLLGMGRRREGLDEGICRRVVEEMCSRGMVEMAFQVFYELVDMGVCLPPPCSALLLSLLRSSGKRREAQFVRKRMGSNLNV